MKGLLMTDKEKEEFVAQVKGKKIRWYCWSILYEEVKNELPLSEHIKQPNEVAAIKITNCQCGAEYTSFPNNHYRWCPKHGV